MNKTELVSAVAARSGLSKSDAEAAVRAFIDVVTENVGSGDGEVTIPGFLSVKRVARPAREAWNPAKQTRMQMPASTGVKLSAGSRLKAAVK
jgi:DNA-binding protein HU-beta